jgi:hypothetical protein
MRFGQVGALRCVGGAPGLLAVDLGVSGAVRGRGGLLGVSGRLALAGGVCLSGVRHGEGVGAGAPAPVAVRGLRSPDLGDRGDGDARNAHAAAELVLAAYLVATHHPGISAKQLQRQLGLSRYETAWLVLQKLRRAMVAPEREPLKEEVEVDECYIGGHDPSTDGRELGKKRLVGVAVEIRGHGSGRLRLQTLTAASGKWLGEFVQATLAPPRPCTPTASLATTAWRRSPLTIAPAASAPLPPPSSCCPAPTARCPTSRLGCTARTAASGLRTCRSTLTITVVRHNRRRTPLAAFQTLLGLSSLHEPTTYDQITRRDKATT